MTDASSGDVGYSTFKDAAIEGINVAKRGSKIFSNEYGKLVDTIGDIDSLYSIFLALRDFAYVTNADYTGEIRVVVKMSKYKYTYRKKYNIYGTVISSEEPDRVLISDPRDPIYWQRSLAAESNKAKFKYEFRAMGVSESGEYTIPRTE